MKATVDRAGVRALAADPGVLKQVEYHARQALDIARAIAPSDQGHYKRLLYLRRVRGGTHSYVEYGSHDFKAWWIEFGSPKIPAHRVLQRSARLAGLRLNAVTRAGRRR